MIHHAKYGMLMAFTIMGIKLFKDEIKDHEDIESTNESMLINLEMIKEI